MKEEKLVIGIAIAVVAMSFLSILSVDNADAAFEANDTVTSFCFPTASVMSR
ncbi:hypothetical protein GQ473_01470, partial [archaeon]|nr:hypothetical protein [archaeon]